MARANEILVGPTLTVEDDKKIMVKYGMSPSDFLMDQWWVVYGRFETMLIG